MVFSQVIEDYLTHCGILRCVLSKKGNMPYKNIEDRKANHKAYIKKKRLEDPEWNTKVRAREKLSYTKRRTRMTPEERKETSRRYALKEKGWTPERYTEFETKQEGRCSVCGTQPTPKDDVKGGHTGLCPDHCHATRKPRGLLCHNCNVGLGNFKDRPELLEGAATYLRQWYVHSCGD